MTDIELYPWQATTWRRYTEAHRSGRLGHGLLLRGPAGLGKRRFADAVAAHLLCEAQDGQPCGECRGCVLRASGNHPDLYVLSPDEEKVQIRIEQVRELVARLGLASQRRGYKVVIIDPAEALNVNAQNSLLKTLEEPPTATELLLVSSRPSALLPTVLSRCQQLSFRLPEHDAALQWLDSQRPGQDLGAALRLAGGAPLRALALADAGAHALDEQLARDLAALIGGQADPVSVAEDWAREQLLLRLRWLQRTVYALVRWRLTGEAPELVHSSLTSSLQKHIAATSVRHLYRYLDAIERAIALTDRTINQVLTLVPLLTVWAGGPRFERTLAETP